MHVSFCAQWGVDLAKLESTPESPVCTAYGAYIMDVGLQGTFGCSHFFRSVEVNIYVCEGDAASLLMALAVCLLGYGEIGLWLQREARRSKSWVKMEENPYKQWIKGYSGDKYQAAVKLGVGM